MDSHPPVKAFSWNRNAKLAVFGGHYDVPSYIPARGKCALSVTLPVRTPATTERISNCISISSAVVVKSEIAVSDVSRRTIPHRALRIHQMQVGKQRVLEAVRGRAGPCSREFFVYRGAESCRKNFQRTVTLLFAPGLPDLAAVSTVCKALSKPVNSWWASRENNFP